MSRLSEKVVSSPTDLPLKNLLYTLFGLRMINLIRNMQCTCLLHNSLLHEQPNRIIPQKSMCPPRRRGRNGRRRRRKTERPTSYPPNTTPFVMSLDTEILYKRNSNVVSISTSHLELERSSSTSTPNPLFLNYLVRRSCVLSLLLRSFSTVILEVLGYDVYPSVRLASGWLREVRMEW